MRPSIPLVLAALVLGVPSGAAAQGAPKLTKTQRSVLEAVVDAVDRAAKGSGAVDEATWSTHVLRASDGSHYVAVRALAPALPVPAGPVVLYVRLASRPEPAATTVAERSAVSEWLRGMRAEPLPMRAGGSMSVPRGEMPVGSIIPGGRDVAAESVAALRLLMLEHEKTKKQREAQAAARRDAMERARSQPSTMLPFEDFDVAARLLVGPRGGIDLRRSLSAGPGPYRVLIGWAEVPARGDAPVVHVLGHDVSLPTAPPVFGLSDIIVGHQTTAIARPYPVDQQNAHPYATGMIEITPAPANVLRVDESLSMVVQVVHPAGTATGKPDVSVQFRIARITGDHDELVGTLPAQRYDETKVPIDFDVAKGHPLFAATRASLASFSRGRYRLTAIAEDHVGGATATSESVFEVRGTPQTLLKEAPRPGRAFQRTSVLAPAALQVLVAALTPAAPSPGLATLLGAASAGRFAELVREVPIDPTERATALLLRALGLYALGDSPRSVAVPLGTALNGGAPDGPALLLQGAVQALAGDDAGAVTAWEHAQARGVPASVIAPLLVDAYVRRGDGARAAALADARLTARPDDDDAARVKASVHLAAGRPAEALQQLERPPLAGRDDVETAFLRLHALFATIVAEGASAGSTERRAEFGAAAGRYIERGAAHAALVAEWQRALSVP